MKIVIIDKAHEVIYRRLKEAGHEVLDLSESADDHVFRELNDAEGVILRSRMNVDRSFMESHPQLKFIGRVGSGIEHIDQEFTAQQGIVVLSSPEGNRDSVAEHALGMLLAWLNRIPRADTQIRNGVWSRNDNRGEELQGKSVGVIGYGNTGSRFSKLLTGFDVDILVYDKYKSGFGGERIKEVEMREIFEKADVVSLHLPLNEETNYLVNRDWISQFQNPFVLINTSRGGIVNSADLVEALNTGKLRGACLDVLEYEQANLRMPDFDTLPEPFHQLLQNDKVILSPHCAGLSPESYFKLADVLAEKIIQKFGSA